MTTQTTPTSPVTTGLIARIDELEVQLLAFKEATVNISAALRELQDTIFGATTESPAEQPAQLPAPKQVGMTVDGNGKRHLSDTAKANISAALKRKAAERKAAAAATK